MVSFSRTGILCRVVVALTWAVIVAGCAHQHLPDPYVDATGRIRGYLAADALPAGAAFLPPPPAAGSVAQALDEEINRAAFALRGTPRWTVAAADADLTFPRAAGALACALGAPITPEQTPHTYRLLGRSFADTIRAASRAKQLSPRSRPFVVNGAPTCTPAEEPHLALSSSYPSGHSAVGWAWALIMSEVAPDRTGELLARGRAFGQSRVICNVHWQSDVVEGRMVGAATVARLHADPVFRADLEAARDELAAVRAAGVPPPGDCRAEDAALALVPQAPWPANR